MSLHKDSYRNILEGALRYIEHVGANHTMRGEPHPQQWLVDGLRIILASQDGPDDQARNALELIANAPDNRWHSRAWMKETARAALDATPQPSEEKP